MRVLTFIHSFEPGGVERVALRLVRSWRESGVDAPLFVGRDEGAMQVELADGLAFGMPTRPVVSVAPFETLWMIASLPRFIRRLRPDILFCAGNSYAVVAVAMKLLLGRRCPPIAAKISNDLERRDLIWPVRKLYHLWLWIQGRFIDHFIAMAPSLEDEIRRLVRPPGDASTVIPDPALSEAQISRLREARRLHTTPPLPKGRRFAAIGRLVKQKNHILMLESFAKGRGPDDMLTIYGDGPDRAMLMQRAHRLGLSSQVHFAGHVANPASLLCDADVFLLSSDYEGVPAVILEALAAGIPIIATDCSAALPYLLDEGRLGTLVPVGDRRTLARAIGRTHIRQDQAASLDRVRQFTIESASRSYLAIFAAIAARAHDGENNSLASCGEAAGVSSGRTSQ